VFEVVGWEAVTNFNYVAKIVENRVPNLLISFRSHLNKSICLFFLFLSQFQYHLLAQHRQLYKKKFIVSKNNFFWDVLFWLTQNKNEGLLWLLYLLTCYLQIAKIVIILGMV